ncbi:MAG: bifunctional riboflavin kinase/FAD synthetase [Candidatus Omnitrophota bacterium]
MEVIYGINKIRKIRKPVVALGVFDGVHLGHRRILKAVVNKARRINGTSVVVTFWPDPHREESLYSLEHRLRLIGDTGLKICIVIKFNKTFSRISAGDFIKKIMVNKLAAQYIYVGRNFRFGRQAKGDFNILERFSHIHNFKLRLFDMVKVEGRTISSTYIRTLITKGKLSAAGKLLSRPVSVLGTVTKGISLAKKLGFPTANIDPHHEVLPPAGIYAVKILFNNRRLQGVCFIGPKTTTPGHKKNFIVEVHIFGFNKNIYGQDIEVEFFHKIRNARKFHSQEALVRQVNRDIASAKKSLIFSLH